MLSIENAYEKEFNDYQRHLKKIAGSISTSLEASARLEAEYAEVRANYCAAAESIKNTFNSLKDLINRIQE